MHILVIFIKNGDMFLLILISIAYRLQEFFQGYCISNTSISLKVTTGVDRREWDSNPATIFAGLYWCNYKKFSFYISLFI